MKISLITILAAFPFFAACEKVAAPVPVPPEGPVGPSTLAVPTQGAYTGAYMDFGDEEDGVTLEKIEAFEALVGKKQAIVASSSYWGEGTFPSANVALISRHGSVPLIFWSPWDRPYVERDEKAMIDTYLQGKKFTLTQIIAGEFDDYIRQWADGARAFGRPMLVSLCNEMNGSWFPWSGVFYGGGKIVPGSNPVSYAGPETFKQAWRHIVDLVRSRGADNVLWVFHVMDYPYPDEPWNSLAQYYPGPEYTDWLGLSVYGQQTREEDWGPFTPLLEWPMKQLAALDPHKPLMLTEWGVGEFPPATRKAAFITEAFNAMRLQPRLRAAIFWHERWQNDGGDYSNLRVNSSPEAHAAYRKGVADGYWLDRPVYVPKNN